MTTFLMPAVPITSLADYLATESGGAGVERAQELGPAATIDLVLRSGLRGRGGGGFPTGQKWAGIAAQSGGRRYVVCNGAEGEPGTFKDRALLRANPYQLVEGLVIAAFATAANEAFVCLKASFGREIEGVTRAVQEFQTAGICADCKVTVVAGPEEYLFGEEKAMLEVIEGNEALPRWLPPHLHGLFATAPQLGWQSHDTQTGQASGSGSNPTLVNNVETLSNIPHILAHGADWFRSMGTDQSPGTIVTTVVGDVLAPDVGEVELGTSLRAVIDAVGSGVTPGRSVKAVFSGVANAVVTAADLDVPVSYEAFQAIGSGIGSAGFIVYDDTTCMVDTAYRLSRFLSVESCGQCPPCKLGSSAITEHLERIEAGVGDNHDLDVITGWLDHVTDGNRCYLAVEEQIMVSSILRAFPDEFVEHIERGRCPRPRRLPIPKLLDLADGHAVYDESFWRKQPDWTYAPVDMQPRTPHGDVDPAGGYAYPRQSGQVRSRPTMRLAVRPYPISSQCRRGAATTTGPLSLRGSRPAGNRTSRAGLAANDDEPITPGDVVVTKLAVVMDFRVGTGVTVVAQRPDTHWPFGVF